MYVLKPMFNITKVIKMFDINGNLHTYITVRISDLCLQLIYNMVSLISPGSCFYLENVSNSLIDNCFFCDGSFFTNL